MTWQEVSESLVRNEKRLERADFVYSDGLSLPAMIGFDLKLVKDLTDTSGI